MARHRINLTDREIAGKVLMALARRGEGFCLFWFYENDVDFMCDLGKEMGLPGNFPGDSLTNRLKKVVRRLVQVGILYGRTSSCQAEYIGEPRVLRKYDFAEPGYACRLAPEKYPHYKPMGKVETELSIFLDRAYPR